MRHTGLIGIIIIVTCVINNSYAQLPGAPVGISKGLKAGMNISNFRGDNVENTKARKALVVGGFLRINLLNVIALQPELLYASKGAQYEEGAGNTLMEITDKINYLEIPVLLRWNTLATGIVNAGLYGGPAFAYKISAKKVTESGGETTKEDLDDVKDTDVGAAVGLGLDLNLGVGSLVGDVRYTLGLNSIYGSALDVKNGVFSVMLGISL